MTQPDVTAFLRSLLLDEASGTPIEDVAIRCDRLEPGDDPDSAPVLLLEEAGAIRDPAVPVYRPFRVMVTAYGRTEKVAGDILRSTTDILHGIGPLVDADGVGLWNAFDETGPQPRQDPETRWPARFCIMDLYMADTLVTVES